MCNWGFWCLVLGVELPGNYLCSLQNIELNLGFPGRSPCLVGWFHHHDACSAASLFSRHSSFTEATFIMKLSSIAITSVLFLPQARALDDLGIGKQGLRHQVDAKSEGVKALVVSYFGVCFAESKLQPFFFMVTHTLLLFLPHYLSPRLLETVASSRRQRCVGWAGYPRS